MPKNESEITIEIGNLPGISARSDALKSYTGEDGEVATPVPGGKLHRCIAVSFCLLCILQAALNISLRLALSFQQNSLTEEREELKRQLNDYASQQNSLTRERDELKRKLNDFANYAQQGWVYFSDSFYYISSIKKTWQGSRDDCLHRGADLIIINSKEEQVFTRQFEKIMWIGLTDRETEARWEWVDRTLLTTSFWYPGEPNNYIGRNEDCVETWYYNDDNSWNDVVCENQNFWICEKKMAL
ncbi:CD209 antigen-like protein E isoform X2 [Micropterus salmoides]|uniref:CD209 antigen-like protein E isoform X2 n=1 Tax=Micropterus salmoides TaxID=27706 RepID=UPI0018EDCB37|nr:CD209 antigen-like protein E isoform X2 [Micropterus salmoides]